MVSIASSPQLFPGFVSQHSVTFQVEDQTDLAHCFPRVALPQNLVTAVRKRQVEFLAGRLCAREALRNCAPEHSEWPVGSGAQGNPLWPPGWIGAITHTRNFASAVVAPTHSARGIGLDIEPLMPDTRAEPLVKSIAASDELAAVMLLTGWSVGVALTVVFSAKEAVFKCLYPEVRRYFDFHDARITKAHTDAGTFEVCLVTALTPDLPVGYRLEGRFHMDDTSVATGLVRPA